jgi:hypothetical protein
MTTQPIQRATDSVKTERTWCALSLGSAIQSLRYLASKETVMSHQASGFSIRNPRNPEADSTKAALD